MIYTQHHIKAQNLAAIKDSLPHNEHIAAVGVLLVTDSKTYTNAIISANERGEITGFFDGDGAVCFIPAEEES